MIEVYENNALKCSYVTTTNYSTSFSLGVKMLNKEYRDAIYSIYGFVRFADEIVDTFHDYNKGELLLKFREDTYEAIEKKISLNPILHSFQWAVNTYNIDHELIDGFLESMEMDLHEDNHDQKSFEKYIYGSAEVVGLMCLRVFYANEDEKYKSLIPFAKRLGAAFQKINFLRDIRDDYLDKGRQYFPQLNIENFTEDTKKAIEADIKMDFDEALIGIKQLKRPVRFGVYLTYVYYLKLFKKIRRVKASRLLHHRIRISNLRKFLLLTELIILYKLRII